MIGVDLESRTVYSAEISLQDSAVYDEVDEGGVSRREASLGRKAALAEMLAHGDSLGPVDATDEEFEEKNSLDGISASVRHERRSAEAVSRDNSIWSTEDGSEVGKEKFKRTYSGRPIHDDTKCPVDCEDHCIEDMYA